MDPDRTKKRKDLLLSEQPMNQSHTTLTRLATMTPADQYAKIQGIVRYNTATLWRQLRWIAEQPCSMRLFRVGSGFLPASTVPEYDHVLKDPAFVKDLSDGLTGVREFADAHGIRLCMHPGQFTNPCSDKDEVVARSIEDLEYHADLARAMGYGDTWHSSGFAINIHANSRQDPGLVRIREFISTKLSPEARNLITLENDEFGCSVDDFVDAGVHKDVALVLDIHHHWVESKGEYLLPSDPRAEAFRESWRGIRPLGHYSLPQPEILNNHCLLTPPDFATLGLKQGKVRSHSNLCWNSGSNDWALSHLPFMDIEVEAKHKNLASRQLYDQAVLRGLVS
jgi:UV DNA damage repair endonuclease